MTASSIERLREAVKIIAEMSRGRLKPDAELKYANGYDFVDRHGREYAPPTPGGRRYRKGRPKACFANSAENTGRYPGLRYVEGFAWTSATEGLPIHHAWNLDADGNVVDTTWDDGTAYLGIEFPVEVFAPALIDGTGSVIDDWKRGFPLYREIWED